MTPDLTTRAVEVLATAMAEFWGDEWTEWKQVAMAAWDALLAARTNCDTCAGTGQIAVYSQAVWSDGILMEAATSWNENCPTCGGSGRGDGLLVAILMERIGFYHAASSTVAPEDFNDLPRAYVERRITEASNEC